MSNSDLVISNDQVVGTTTGEELLRACFENLQYAEMLIKSSRFAEINWRDSNSNSILHICAYRDHHEAIELLVNSGADVNIRNRYEETPLHWACKVRGLFAVNALLRNGAVVNLQDKTGSTPVHVAASKAIPEIIAYILPYGFDPDITDEDGKTAKMIADEASDDGSFAISVLLERYLRSRTDTVQSPILDISVSPTSPSRSGTVYYRAESNASIQVDEDMLASAQHETGIVTKLDVIYEKKQHKSLLDLREKIGHMPKELTHSMSPLAVSLSSHTFYESMKGQLKNMAKKMNSRLRHHHNPKAKFGFWSSTAKILPLCTVKDDDEFKKWTIDNKGDVVPYDPHAEITKVKELPKKVLYVETDSVLPEIAQPLDTVVIIEHCCDCMTHSSSLWHDARKYQNIADNLLLSISRYLIDEGYSVRFFALKIRMESTKFRYGAFEVSISTFTDCQWETISLHSKLATRSWPCLRTIKVKIDSFLVRVIPTVFHGGFVKNPNRLIKTQLTRSYDLWANRMFGIEVPKYKLTPEIDVSVNTCEDGIDDRSRAVLTSETPNFSRHKDSIAVIKNTWEGILEKAGNMSADTARVNSSGSPYFDLEKHRLNSSSYWVTASEHFMVFDAFVPGDRRSFHSI